MKIRKRIFIILTIAWMIIIFLMSSQPAPDSTETSLAVGHTVCTLFVPGYSKMSTDDQLQLAKRLTTQSEKRPMPRSMLFWPSWYFWQFHIAEKGHTCIVSV